MRIWTTKTTTSRPTLMAVSQFPNHSMRSWRHNDVMAKKQSSSKLSALAARVLSNPKSGKAAKRLAGSVLTQDETPGQKPKLRRKSR